MTAEPRYPPHDLSAEQALLGAMLINVNAVDVAVGMVKSTDFYRDAHRRIFETIESMSLAGEPIDQVTVSSRMGAVGDDRDLLFSLTEYVPSAANAAHYARQVADLSLRREVIRSCQEILDNAYDTPGQDSLADAEKKLLSLDAGRPSSGPESFRDLLACSVSRIGKAASGEKSCGKPTGIGGLNKLIGGLEDASYFVLAARPSIGKTSLAMQIARHVAEQSPTVFFSVEMTNSELVDRLLCTEACVPLTRYRAGEITPSDEASLLRAVENLSGLNLHLDDSISSMDQISRTVRKMSTQIDIGLIVIDYIQLLSFGRKQIESRQQEVAQISRAIKLMAREHRVPILALSQLSRPEKRYNASDASTEPEPTLAALRESGAIEQDADIVAFLHKKKQDDNEDVKLLVKKNRNGATGVIKMRFTPHLTKFTEMI